MKDLNIAILDMNNDKPNQGLRCIQQIVKQFLKEEVKGEFKTYNVRGKNEVPEIKNYDIFISSGGPGTPFEEGKDWEPKYYAFLDSIIKHNKQSERKKYLFLICHSFQIACMHWNIGKVCKRYSYSFGIMPTHKTEEGIDEVLFKNLPDPFYVMDSREFQVIQPNFNVLDELGSKITSLEKIRPHVDFERAIMSLRFTDEIFGTQFHPEADAEGMQEHFEKADKKKHIIESYGEKKYYDTIDKIDDPDKILLTEKEILPNFLRIAANQLIPEAV